MCYKAQEDISSVEQWLRAHTRNTAYKASTLVRYYLFECALFSVCLHKFIKDDTPGIFHNHPFDWVSVFWGRYTEEIFGQAPKTRWCVNYGGAAYHRVSGMSGRWSIVIITRDKRVWGYKTYGQPMNQQRDQADRNIHNP